MEGKQIIGQLEQLTQEIQRSQSSVEISTNSKGEKSWKVKAYADTVEEAISLAVDADHKIAEKLKGAE